MTIRIQLSNGTRKEVLARLKSAYRGGDTRLIRRIHALLMLVEGQSVSEVADLLGLGEQTVRDWRNAFLQRGVASLVYKRPPGRPKRLTKRQRCEIEALLEAGPEAAGYESGCWSALLVQEMIETRYQVRYHPHYVAHLLKQWGFSFQKARFVSDHLNAAARVTWLAESWPQLVKQARRTGALLLFGDEASFAQWGSLSYTWARKGQQPTIKTSGKRRAYKVFGLIDAFSGRFFYQAHSGRFNSASYQAFLEQVLEQTTQPIILMQDGARYHTSKAMQQFFASHATRLSVVQLPSYSPDFNPIEFLWKKLKKRATHLRYFAEFNDLIASVDDALCHFAHAPHEITVLMGRYCASLGEDAPDLPCAA